MRRVLRSLGVALVSGAVVMLGACASSGDGVTASSISSSDAVSSDAVSEPGYNPALSGEDRVALVSKWAQERHLLTGAEVVAALGESTTEVVDASSPEVWMFDEWGGFRGPFSDKEVAVGGEVQYVLLRKGDSRIVITYVYEALSQGQAVAEAYLDAEQGEKRRNSASERYEPAPIGVNAFAYETDGGSGALDRLVVVDTGNALVVIVASPASPNDPDADLTVGENLSREQVDKLVTAAVEKLG